LGERRFVVELIKPSHYDDDGYVIQWWKSWIPSNSLASLYGIASDIAKRRALGTDVAIDIRAYDECHTVIPLRRIIRRIKSAGAGLVCFVGVQSNQFPRAIDLARPLRQAGIAIAIGGFHVSGCLAMLPKLPPDLQAAIDLGVTLFAGEAEGRLEDLFADAFAGRLQPIYNYMDDLPALQQQVTPFLPIDIVRRYGDTIGAFDAGRGCPFQCSFCTIINVQGRKSRWRDADDVERLLRANLAQGVFRFFITDDNFARNKNWEAIFDRLILMREQEGLRLQFIIQVDTLCHRIPNFVEKAARAGCKRVFIGLENINPDSLLSAKKKQNRVHEYREMFLAWRARQVITYAGYILGFPGDTPQRIAHDIATVQRELPVDLLEFFILTPLPGSADHKAPRYEQIRFGACHDRPSAHDRGRLAKDLPRSLGPLLFDRAHRNDLLACQGVRHQAGAAVEPHPAVLLHVHSGECASATRRLLPPQNPDQPPGGAAAREPGFVLSAAGRRGRHDPRQARRLLSLSAPDPPPR
jgi:Radical SAM superfamily